MSSPYHEAVSSHPDGHAPSFLLPDPSSPLNAAGAVSSEQPTQAASALPRLGSVIVDPKSPAVEETSIGPVYRLPPHSLYSSPVASPKYTVSVLKREVDQSPAFQRVTQPYRDRASPQSSVNTLSSPSLLPPSSSLGSPRFWPPGFRQNVPSNVTPSPQQLPQVSSLAGPNSLSYFGQNTPTYFQQQTNFSLQHYSPVSAAGRFPSPAQSGRPSNVPWALPESAAPRYPLNGQETWQHPPQNYQYHSQILRQQSTFHPPSDLSRTNPSPAEGVIHHSSSGFLNSQVLRDSSSLAASTSGYSGFISPDSGTSSNTLTVKPHLKMTDKSPRPKRKPKVPKVFDNTTGIYDLPLVPRKSRGPSLDEGEASHGFSEDSASVDATDSQDTKKKANKPKLPTPKPPPPPPENYSLKHKRSWNFVAGDKIEASDATNTWYKARVVQVSEENGHFHVHFEGWNSRYDEWIPMDSKLLRPLTAEKFSEHQEKYNLGDMVIARWTTGLQKAGIVTDTQHEPERYTILYHEGTVKSVTNKGMRRMSPVLREKHAAELEELRVIASSHPLLVQVKDPPVDTPPSLEPPLQLHGEIEIASGAEQKPDPAADASQTAALDALAIIAQVEKKPRSYKKKKSAVADNIAASSSGMPDSYSKPKRQTKAPVWLGDNVLDDGRKKRKKKALVPVEETSADLPVVVEAAVAVDVPLSLPPKIVTTSPGVIVERNSIPRNVSPRPEPPLVPIQSPSPKKADSVSPAVHKEEVVSNSVLKTMLKKDGAKSSPSMTHAPPKTPGYAYEPPVQILPGTDMFQIDDIGNSGIKKCSLMKAAPKVVAPKEMIIKIDHNEFKCTEDKCLKSFRKQKLLLDHLRHYHGIGRQPEDEEEKAVVTPSGRKSRKESLENAPEVELPTTPVLSPRPKSAMGGGEGSTAVLEVPVFSIPDPLPETPLDAALANTYKEMFRELPSPSTVESSSGKTLSPSASSEDAKPVKEEKTSRRWKRDEQGEFYAVEGSQKKDSRSKKQEEEAEDIAHYIQSDHELVHCRCDYELESGFMVQCELCATWQHGHCYDINCKDDVPKHYICDFCRTPNKVRFSQRQACHDLPFFSTGRLPVFTPLSEDEDVSLPAYPAPPASLSAANKVVYTQLAADTGYCNDQLRTLTRIGKALRGAEEVHLKNGIMLSNMCVTQTERIKLSNAVNAVPDELIDSLNIHDVLDDLELFVSEGDSPIVSKEHTENDARAAGTSAVKSEPMDVDAAVGQNEGNRRGVIFIPTALRNENASAGAATGHSNLHERVADENSDRGSLPEESSLMSAMPEIDEDVMELCLQGDFPAVLKALHNREESMAVYLVELESRLLEMEKACDARYGTQFAANPHSAAQDCEELREKAYEQQSDLRNMERLGYVVAVRPREKAAARPLPGPVSVSESLKGAEAGTRPPLPVKIRLSNGKAAKKLKVEKVPRRTKKPKELRVTASDSKETESFDSPMAMP